jgi:alpha-ketoglutarate-dependent taurine dioxygenase
MVSLATKSSSADQPKHIQVSPLTLTIGAEISRVDLKRPLSSEQLKEVRAAFLKWKVIFFRGQHIDHAQHIAFARQFGEPTIGHAVFGHVDEFPEVYTVAKVRAGNSDHHIMPRTPWHGWHTDITAAINPPAASILRGVTIPPYGGDTCWTNLAAAYNGLSKPMRDFVDGLRGIHKFVPRDDAGGMEYNDLIKKRAMETEHPLVTVHPETGERVLYVSPSFLATIVDMTPRESQKILEILWEHSTRSDYTVRFKWNEGDVAFWDNRSTSHLAPTDILDSDFDRLLYRVTIVGEVPTGVDGRASRSLKGEPLFSAAHELEKLKAVAGGMATDV